MVTKGQVLIEIDPRTFQRCWTKPKDNWRGIRRNFATPK